MPSFKAKKFYILNIIAETQKFVTIFIFHCKDTEYINKSLINCCTIFKLKIKF